MKGGEHMEALGIVITLLEAAKAAIESVKEKME